MDDLLSLLPPEFPLPPDVHAGAELAAANADAWWLSCAETAISYFAGLGQPFTADDVRSLVPEPDEPNRWGGVFRRAYSAGVIEPTGSARPSSTGSRRGGLLREWRGVAA
jgi:hypothetical protein